MAGTHIADSRRAPAPPVCPSLDAHLVSAHHRSAQPSARARARSTHRGALGGLDALLPDEDAARVDEAPLVDGEAALDEREDAERDGVEDDEGVRGRADAEARARWLLGGRHRAVGGGCAGEVNKGGCVWQRSV